MAEIEVYRRGLHFQACFVDVYATSEKTADGDHRRRVHLNAGATMTIPDALELAETILEATREIAIELEEEGAKE